MSTQSPSTQGPLTSSKPQKYPNNIRKAIKQSPWKLYEVAEKTDIPRVTLVDYCAGKYPVPHERRNALAELLQCQPEYLVPPLPNARAAYESQNTHEETKDLQALLVLRTHCETHPTDENALQQLMELLGKVGRSSEMEKWYERFVKEVKKVDIWRRPDADTSALLARLRAQAALGATELPPEKGEQRAPTDEKAAKEREDSSPSLGELTLSPGLGLPSSLPDPDPQAPVTSSDTVIIQTSQVQIVVQPFPDETLNGRTTPSVLVTSPSAPTEPTAKGGEPPTASSKHVVSSLSQSVNPQDIILIGAGANAPSLDAKNLRDHHLASSTDIVPSLKVYSTHCQGEVTTCRQQRDIYETIEQRRTMNDEQSQLRDPTQITRRDLFTLAVVSPALLANMRCGWPPAGVTEEFLSEATASVTTCWYLLQRSDGLPTVELALPQYLPELEALVKFSSLYRQRAAYLAAQGFLLRGLVAHHRTLYAERIANYQKAITYAHESGDLTLLVTSLGHLGDAFLINGQTEESLKMYLQAEDYSKGLSGFLRSKILGEVSHPYARQGNDQEVVRYLGEAYATFTEADGETPVFLSADYDLHQTILFEGLSTLDLGDHAKDQGRLSRARKYWKDAAERFGKMEQLPSGLSVPVRIAAEVLIAQAAAYAKARNMEGFLTGFEKGVQLAKKLGSQKRKQEAIEALKAALEQWPNDLRITGLWELLV